MHYESQKHHQSTKKAHATVLENVIVGWPTLVGTAVPEGLQAGDEEACQLSHNGRSHDLAGLGLDASFCQALDVPYHPPAA